MRVLLFWRIYVTIMMYFQRKSEAVLNTVFTW